MRLINWILLKHMNEENACTKSWSWSAQILVVVTDIW